LRLRRKRKATKRQYEGYLTPYGLFQIGFHREHFQLCERTIRSRVALRKEGQVELLGDA
jgi:hypothetical protein